MTTQIVFVFLFIAGYLLIIFLSEYLYKRLNINPEYTRKIAHILATLSSLLLIFIFNSHWYVLILSTISFLILFLGKYRNLLKSIDSIIRKSSGSYLLPISVYLVFLISNKYNNSILYILPILILGISDPLAGIFGVYFKSKTKQIKLFNHELDKTILGSTVFFISSLIISSVTLYIFNFNLQEIFIISFTIASITTFTELISSFGFDNLTVPLITALILLIMH